MIKNSLDWSRIRTVYSKKIKELPYNRDIRLMLNNIDKMVNDLSKAEVEARRKNISIETLPELNSVNNAIQNLEKWIMMAALLQ